MKKSFKRAVTAVTAIAMVFSNLSVTERFSSSQTAYAAETEDYTQYVDPFVGTDVDYGQLFPGSVTPSGLVKLSPDTYPHKADDHAGYDYSKLQISGFSHTRIEGVGGQGAGGDVLITPTYLKYDARPTAVSKAQTYSHDNETASPGYYSVEMTPNVGTGKNYKPDETIGNIKAELTSNTRTGYHKYTFPKDGDVSLLVDLNYTYHGTDIRNAILKVEESETTTGISGRFSGRNVSGHGKYTMYFYMETSQPAKTAETWDGSALSESLTQAGNDLGAILTFSAKKDTPIEVKVSISPVSAEQAKKDMKKEIPGWNFEEARSGAKAQWNEILGKVKIESSEKSDPDGKLKRLFYTHLYHMFTTPVNATSTDGTFRATDLNIYEANDYTHYDSWTLWDDFRKYPMIGLILPEVYKDFIRSIANTMEYGIGTWGIDTQTVPTVRTEHAVALLADGVAKGFDDIDNMQAAYNKSKEIADGTINSAAEARGYVSGRVDKTVEFSYDDWAISLLAKNLENDADYQRYLKRSFFYKNLYKADAVSTDVNGQNETMGLLWPKDDNGAWKNADPEKYGDNGIYQGTLWQYTWWDSNDVNGLLYLMGSKEQMAKQLHYLYGMHDKDNGKRMLHSNTNEIDLHSPYLFNFVGEPYNTQYWVRQIYTKQTWNRYSGTGEYKEPIYDYAYKLDPAGFLETMDDDAGTMASMYVSAAMGLFPMAPGDTSFQIGTPFFEKMTLDVGNGKTFVIEADNVSPDNFYIQSATLNGKSFDRTWIDYSEIIRGGTLKFNMGSNPSSWAVNGVTALSSSDLADTAIYDTKDPLSYSAITLFESDKNDGSIEQKITISLRDAQAKINAAAEEDLIAAGKVSIGNVPAGLTAAAKAMDDTHIEVSFSGNAARHEVEDSIGNLSLTLEDSLFTQTITSVRKSKDNIKLMFEDDKIVCMQDKLTEEKENGVVSGSAIFVLTGDTKLNGADGEDFVASQKVRVIGAPFGLTPSMVKLSDNQLEFTLNGTAILKDMDVDDMTISFEDTAFHGKRACQISGSNYGGMKSLIVDFSENWKERLFQINAIAKQIDKKLFTTADYAKLQGLIAIADALTTPESDNEALCEKTYEGIYNIIYDLPEAQDAGKRLEAENFSVWSANGLKTENGTDSAGQSLVNLGATYNGAYLGYEKLDFTDKNIASFSVRYVNNTSAGKCAPDAAMEIRLGSPDGELLQKVPMPGSGNNWNSYTINTVNIEAPEKLTGTLDVYFVLTGTTGAGKASYIANIDWMQFNKVTSYGIYQAENYNSWSANGLKTEGTTTSDGESITNLGATYNGAWVGFEKISFSGERLEKVGVSYVNNSGRCAPDASIEVRLDKADGKIITTIPIPATGDNWSKYQYAESTLTEKVDGIHDVYFVLRGTTTGSNPFIANIDYFKFIETLDKTGLQALYAQAQKQIEQEDANTENSVKTLKAVMSKADEVIKDENVVQSKVTAMEKKLAEAIKNLKPLTKIRISSFPVKPSHTLGEPIDFTGLTVWAVYSDNSTKQITNYKLDETNASKLGNQRITVSFLDFKQSFTVLVVEKEEPMEPPVDPNPPIDPEKPSIDPGETPPVILPPAEEEKPDEPDDFELPKVNDNVKSDFAKYIVTKSDEKDGTLTYTAPASSKKTAVNVPSIMKVNGIDFKVTAIAANAFKGNTEIKTIAAGTNISTIGANAFAGAKNLKKITLKSSGITTIGKDAFKGINSKAIIYVPAKQYTKYVKMMKAAGLPKTVTIQKI